MFCRFAKPADLCVPRKCEELRLAKHVSANLYISVLIAYLSQLSLLVINPISLMRK